ncbi:glycosyltransferase family 4 protein [Bradyrhizobium sp. dw_411]|uniref:MraY family glycosyltransferase n=1 Tax=Bradyrhizobium sp. dw_411 TaxID=2720082 RepID=UPI001BCC86FE|nr:glycosyltransferase family 4 protein [Bradyrhizobium sp. dw_411]
MTISDASLFLLAIVAAAIISAGLTAAIRPLLLKHALANPNARSSHRIPTPQGAGIAVIAATLVVAAAIMAGNDGSRVHVPIAVFGATLFIAIVGFADDLKSIPVVARLLLQAVAVGAIVFAASDDVRIVPACPLWLERSLILLAGLWFVNLVNFMDGLDWMTVAEIVPVTSALVVLGSLSEFSLSPAIMAAALCGAMIGFAPFNRPVAKIFLGDVGSLPIGLLLGWCLMELASHQHLAAALLLPLYYLADASVTLLRRMIRREPFWAAHRSHFYQRATDNGFSVWRVVSEVFVLNVVLAGLAIASTRTASLAVETVLLLVGGAAVTFSMYRFSQPRTS